MIDFRHVHSRLTIVRIIIWTRKKKPIFYRYYIVYRLKIFAGLEKLKKKKTVSERCAKI